MQQQEVNELLKKYLAGNCTAKERGLLETWYLKHEEKELPVLSQEKKDQQLEEVSAFLSQVLDIPALRETSAAAQPKTSAYVFAKIAIAAMVLIALSVGFYFYKTEDNSSTNLTQPISRSASPSNNKAMLTLADGRKISLDEAQNGEIAEQAGVTITKTKDGQLVYAGKTNVNALNNIATPKGGQYQVSLPDGTKVWLNAASSLSYPASFTGAKREVNLLGEAYFEVSKNAEKPFVVHTRGQEVMVLGTHFNVNAYEDDDETKTTLVEGSVKVRMMNSSAAVLLRPGQQALFESNQLSVAPVDVTEAIAWKEGQFLFQDEDIKSIMRKIARWYDVEVVYAPGISDKRIGGNISRSKPLSAVLKTLSNTDNFNFKVEGRRVTVMP